MHLIMTSSEKNCWPLFMQVYFFMMMMMLAGRHCVLFIVCLVLEAYYPFIFFIGISNHS